VIDSILITGSGTTSRANVEALLDDYLYANPELIVYLAIDGEASQGQIWAAQYAVDKGKSVFAQMTRGSIMMGIPTTVPREQTISPIVDVCQLEKNLIGFVLWNDEDQACLKAVEILTEYGFPALDLTNGLCEIKIIGNTTKSEPIEIPKSEQLSEVELDNREQETDIETSQDLVEDEEEVYEDPLYEAINVVAGVVAGIFAEAFIKKLQKGLTK